MVIIYIWYFHKKTKFLKLLSSQTGVHEQILRGLKNYFPINSSGLRKAVLIHILIIQNPFFSHSFELQMSDILTLYLTFCNIFLTLNYMPIC